jgi:hypothetical protein
MVMKLLLEPEPEESFTTFTTLRGSCITMRLV